MTGRRPARVGLIVNPIAGMGGRVGLKGTDGADTLARARALGAQALAPARGDAVEATLRAVGVIVSRVDPGSAEGTRLAAASLVALAPPPSGRPAGRAAALRMAGEEHPRPCTNRLSTRQPTSMHRWRGKSVDLLLFVGGDGTARDVCVAAAESVAVLGVPSGVKMHSGVFATSAAAAAEIAVVWLASGRRTREADVVDIDEAAVRGGRMEVRLYGTLRVPDVGGRIQALKATGGRTSAAELSGLAAEVVGRLSPGSLVVLGPGTTTRAVGRALGIEPTLLGVDVVEVGQGRRGRTVALDASESAILAALDGRPATAILSPTGGQGFLVGRGNQQLSPAVLASIGAPAARRGDAVEARGARHPAALRGYRRPSARRRACRPSARHHRPWSRIRGPGGRGISRG